MDAGTEPAMLAAQILAVILLGAVAYFSGLHRYLQPMARRVSDRVGALKDASRSPQATPARSDGSPSAPGTVFLADLEETSAREVMTSRVDIAALPITATLDEALDLIRESGHSRLPLYDEHLDTILGIVYAKDLLSYLKPADGTRPPARIDWSRIARPALFVPFGKALNALLREFQARKTHVAIVVDEYGGTAGLVTMEDILEELVGDIRDEHDHQEQALFEQVGPSAYRVDARINLDDLNELLGVRLDTDQFEFESLGGLLLHLAGGIPEPGSEITYENVRTRVESVEAHRIGHVLVQVEPPEHPKLSEAATRAQGRPLPEAAYRAAGLVLGLGGFARLLQIFR